MRLLSVWTLNGFLAYRGYDDSLVYVHIIFMYPRNLFLTRTQIFSKGMRRYDACKHGRIVVSCL